MSDSSLFNLLVKLESSKIKDRNDALAGIETFASSDPKINHRDLTSLVQSLFVFLEAEKALYKKNQAAAVESRLQTSSYLLRKVIVKNVRQMKFKLAKEILNSSREALFSYDDNLIKPLALNISKVIHAIIATDEHREHISSEDWLKLTESILRILNKQIKNNMIDKFVYELLCTLKIMVLNPQMIIEDVGYDLSDFLVKYFNNFKKESSLTALILEITNNLIIVLSTSKMRHSLKMVKSVVRVAGSIVSTNYDSLKDQLLVFGLLFRDFICEQLPKLVQIESSQDDITEDPGLTDDLEYWLDQWLQLTIKSPAESLNINDISFTNTDGTQQKTWFDFGPIRLSKAGNPKSWLNLLAIVNLTSVVYKLRKPQMLRLEGPVKKRRLDLTSFSTVIERSSSSLELFSYFCRSGDIRLQVLGFQSLIFHIYNYNFALSDIRYDEIIKFYDKPELSGYTSLLFRSLIDQGRKFEGTQLSQILRINLQMLKDRSLSNIACQTIIQILSYPEFNLTETALKPQIHSLFEFSEINGPASISDDSLKFWIIFSQFGKDYRSNDRASGNRILDWLVVKWDFEIISNCTVFSHFMSWMIKGEFTFCEEDITYENSFNSTYLSWSRRSKLANFILNSSHEFPGLVVSSNFQQANVMYNSESITLVVDRLLKSMEYYDRQTNGLKLFKFLRFSYHILQILSEREEFDSCSERLKYDIRKYMESIDTDKPDYIQEAVSQLSNLVYLNDSGEFIFDCFNVHELVSDAKKLNEASGHSSNPAILENFNDFGEFGEVRKEADDIESQAVMDYSKLSSYKTFEQKLLDFIVSITSRFSYTKNLNATVDQAIRFIEGLEPNVFSSAFFSLLEFLDKVDTTKIQTVSISRLLRLLGNKLLSSYKYERSPITIILASRLFIVFTKSWLMKINESWASDYSDMFKWIVSLAEKGLITEELSSYYFIKSIFVKLAYESDPSAQSIGIDLFHKSSNLNKYSLCSDIKLFMNKLSTSEQIYCFEAVHKGFINPHELDDLSATFTYCIEELGEVSYPIFILGICQLLFNYGYFHFKPYVEAAFFKADQNVMKQKMVLLEIFKYWLNTQGEFDTFPYVLLGVETFEEFVMTHKNLIYAVYVANKKTPISLITNNNILGGLVDESELLVDTIFLSIPLSFSKHGRRSEIFELIGDLYDSSLIEHQTILIVNTFLSLCDYSNESNIVKYIPSIEQNDEMKLIFSGGLSQMSLYSFVKISIPTSIVIHEISHLISKQSNKFWTPSTASFLLKRSLSDLNMATVLTEKVLCIRKVKLILALGHEGLTNNDVLFSVIEILSPYLRSQDTHYEVSKIILFLLKAVDSICFDNERYYRLLLGIILDFLEFKKSGMKPYHPLESRLIVFYGSSSPSGIWKLLFLPLTYLLTSNTTALEETLVLDYHSDAALSPANYISVHDILKFTAKSFPVKVQVLVMQFLATLFDRVPHLNEIDIRLVTDDSVANLLLHLKILMSANLTHFKSRYLGRHYMNSGEYLANFDTEIENSFEHNISTHTSNLYSISNKMLEVKSTTTDVEELLLIDEFFGVGLFEHLRGSLNSSSLIDFDLHLKNSVKTLMPLDLFTFNLLNPDSIETSKFSQLANNSGIEKKSTDLWSRDIVLSILGDINDESPIFSALRAYIFKFPSVSKKVLAEIVLFYIRQGRVTEERHVVKFISNILGRSDVLSLSKEKLKYVLSIVYYLRIGMDDVKTFKSIIYNLDLRKIYQVSTYVKMPKFSLLMFETYFTDPVYKSPTLWSEESDSLKHIYQQLDDEDLFYGLPAQPTLQYAIEALSRDQKNSWRNVIFNSANLDSSSILKDYTNFELHENKKTLLKSLIKDGLLQVSDILNDTLDPDSSLKNSYEWCWKLNRWDIPVNETPNSEDEYIYNSLKLLHDTKDGVSACVSLMDKALVSEVEGKKGMMRTLSSLSNIEMIQSIDSSSLFEELELCNRSTDNWFSFASFSEIENILLTRRISYGEGHVQLGAVDRLLFQIAEVKRYGSYARLHGELQKATNAAMLMDKMVKFEPNAKINKYLSKLSSFEAACTLWDQGETEISIAMLKDNLKRKVTKPNEIMLDDLQVFDSVLNAYLVKWTSESRQEKFENIMQSYVQRSLQTITEVSSSKERAKVYHILGYFCYKQTNLSGSEEEIERQEKLLKEKHSELQDLRVIIQNKATPADEKKNAKRYYQRIQLQYEADKETFNTLFNNRNTCIEKALEFYLNAIAIDNTYDNEDIDKICALWLEYSQDENINRVVSQWISKVSCHKFISWLNQLVSRLADENSSFQSNLQALLSKICHTHPYHSLYFIMNLRVHKLYQISKTDAIIHSRSVAAENLWKTISSKSGTFTKKVLDPIYNLSRNALTLATEKVPSGTKKMNLENLKVGDFWMNELKLLDIPLPTINNLPIDPSGRYHSVRKIINVSSVLQISSSGISLPKIMKLQLSDGSTHKMLLKGSTDDLRQDAIMEQVFEKVNDILKNIKETRRKGLKMRTYKVVPLGPQAGMIEFVANSIALSDILRPLHSKDSISFNEAREMMRNCQSSNTKERLNVYLKICKETPPVFRFFFYDTFPNIDEWYRSRQVYTRGIATNSIVGHMLGLGDRHLNNILIDDKTGEPIHIDLGVAFDQGKLLPVPELVPFRLTRDIVDGLGITGVEGSFKKGSEHVFRALRDNVEKIVGILNVLKYDPLYSWAISPIRKKRLQEIENLSVISTSIEGDGSDAARAIKGVETKLNSNGLSVEASVQELIQEATDYNNLGVIYLGWTPFY